MVGLFSWLHLAARYPHLPCQPLDAHSSSRHITKSEHCSELPYPWVFTYVGIRENDKCVLYYRLSTTAGRSSTGPRGVFHLGFSVAPGARRSFCCQLEGQGQSQRQRTSSARSPLMLCLGVFLFLFPQLLFLGANTALYGLQGSSLVCVINSTRRDLSAIEQ